MVSRLRHILIFALFVAQFSLTACVSIAELPPDPTRILLFDSGQEGYPRYRIPSLIVAPNGDVLAVCEGRKDGRGLTGNIDLVLKRSSDNGRTWNTLYVIADDGNDTLGNPCLVIDDARSKDRNAAPIWLAFTRSHGSDTESEIVEGRSRERTRVFITNSQDNGKTWSQAKDITATVKKPSWTWYGTGPGIGIQLQSGRLLIPSYHVEEDDQIYRSHAIFSDDHGQTWRHGAAVGDHTSEAHVIERSDGSIYLDTRTVFGRERRSYAVSRDQGETWSKVAFRDDLYDSHCQGCLLRDPIRSAKNQGLTFFSNPIGPGRRNLTIRASFDDGQNWFATRQLHVGDSQYSCLALLRNNTVGCLYESWQDGNYRIFFVSRSMGWFGKQMPYFLRING